MNSEESQAREGRLSFLERAVAQINHQLGQFGVDVQQNIFPWLSSLQTRLDQEVAERIDAVADVEMHLGGEVARLDGAGGGRGRSGFHEREKQPMISRRGFDTVQKN